MRSLLPTYIGGPLDGLADLPPFATLRQSRSPNYYGIWFTTYARLDGRMVFLGVLPLEQPAVEQAIAEYKARAGRVGGA